MKRVLVFCALIVFFFSCFACGKAPSADLAEDASSTPAPYELGMTYHEVYDPDTDFDNRFGRCAPGMLETEDAYYFVSTTGNYIYYYDKYTEERGVLCGKPECVHDELEINESCSGYVRASGNGHANFYDGHIYYTGYSNSGDSPVRQSLYRMNPDGSSRERLFPFTCTYEDFPNGGTQIHRGKLYGCSRSSLVAGAEPKEKVCLTCWDLETGESKRIYERTDATQTFGLSVFYFGKYVYFCDSYFYLQQQERMTIVTVLRWDIEAEELETVYTGEGYGGSYYNIWVESENKIYFAPNLCDAESTKVYCISNGEVRIAVELSNRYTASLMDGAVAFIDFLDESPEPRFIVTDYEGNPLYDGKCSHAALEELPGRPECMGYSAVYGDKDTVYIVYELDYHQVPRFRQCIVRYNLRDGEIVGTKLLCVSKW